MTSTTTELHTMKICKRNPTRGCPYDGNPQPMANFPDRGEEKAVGGTDDKKSHLCRICREAVTKRNNDLIAEIGLKLVIDGLALPTHWCCVTCGHEWELCEDNFSPRGEFVPSETGRNRGSGPGANYYGQCIPNGCDSRSHVISS